MTVVKSSVDQKDHQQFQDLVGGAALGILTAEEHGALMAHLETCADCQLELSEFTVVVDLLPLSLDEMAPSPALRNRVQMQIQSKLSSEPPKAENIPAAPVREVAPPVEMVSPPRRRKLPDANQEHDFVPIPIGTAKSHRRRPSPFFWGIAALALVAIISGAVIGRYFLANTGNDNQDREQKIALNFTGAMTSDTATLTFFPKTDLLVFSASDLPPAPEGHVYQVWMIANKTPLPMGTIGPSGYATVANIKKFDAFAVTVEPGPLGSPQPTTKPFIEAPFNPSTS